MTRRKAARHVQKEKVIAEKFHQNAGGYRMNNIKHHVLQSHSSSSDESMYEEEEVIEEVTPREAPTSPKEASEVRIGTR